MFYYYSGKRPMYIIMKHNINIMKYNIKKYNINTIVLVFSALKA